MRKRQFKFIGVVTGAAMGWWLQRFVIGACTYTGSRRELPYAVSPPSFPESLGWHHRYVLVLTGNVARSAATTFSRLFFGAFAVPVQQLECI